jgi:hypothetical protein
VWWLVLQLGLGRGRRWFGLWTTRASHPDGDGARRRRSSHGTGGRRILPVAGACPFFHFALPNAKAREPICAPRRATARGGGRVLRREREAVGKKKMNVPRRKQSAARGAAVVSASPKFGNSPVPAQQHHQTPHGKQVVWEIKKREVHSNLLCVHVSLPQR